MAEKEENAPVTYRYCNLRHQEVDHMRDDLDSQRKMLWGIIVMQLIILGGIITKVAF